MECFCVNSQEIEGRLDCHFYRPEFVILDKKIKHISNKKLQDYIVSISSGATPDIKQSENYYSNSNEGITFMRVQNVTPQGLDLEDVKFINKETHDGMLKRSQVSEFDLLVKITGVGRMAVSSVTPKDFAGNINQHLVIIKTKNEETSNILATFLNSDIGEKLATKRATGGTRPALDYKALKSIPIVFKSEIVKVMRNAIFKSKQKESEALTILNSVNDYVLDELKIKFDKIVEDKTYCVNFEDIDKKRNDPYYFNPKFDRLLGDLEKSKIKIETLKEVSTKIFSGKTPPKEDYSDEGNLILKVNCLRNNKILWHKLSYFKDGVPAVKEIKNNDIVLLSSAHQADYLGKNPCIVEIPENLKDKKIYFVGELISIRVNPEKINPYYLLAVLKLEEYYLLVNREKRGQSSHLYSQDLERIKIPFPSLPLQNKIAEEVKRRMQKAETLQKEANEELEKAKSEVEKIILG
jgi:restriction endonuclease S subunit